MITVIPSGTLQSPTCVLPRSDRPHVIFVPSLAANVVFSIAFAPNSGGPTFHRGVFAGRDYVVASAGQPACGRFDTLSPFARVTLGAATTSPVSVEILPTL